MSVYKEQAVRMINRAGGENASIVYALLAIAEAVEELVAQNAENQS